MDTRVYIIGVYLYLTASGVCSGLKTPCDLDLKVTEVGIIVTSDLDHRLRQSRDDVHPSSSFGDDDWWKDRDDGKQITNR